MFSANASGKFQVEPTRDNSLNETALRLHECGESAEVLEMAARNLRRLCGADAEFVYTLDTDWSELCWQPPEGGETVRFPVGEGIAGWVAGEREPRRSGDGESDPQFNAAIDLPDGRKASSFLSLPLLGVRGDALGVVQLVAAEKNRFKPRHEEEPAGCRPCRPGLPSTSEIGRRLLCDHTTKLVKSR